MSKNIKKVCRRCAVEQSVKDFGPCKSTKDKLQVWCNSCRRAYALDRYNRNKSKMNTKRLKLYYDTKAMAASFQAYVAKDQAENPPGDDELM